MEVGNWMRNKETGEAVKIKTIRKVLIKYGNDDVDGEVQTSQLAEQFDVLDDPSEKDDIEFLLKAKIEADEAETGLYDCGICYVVADRVNGEVTFQWFDTPMEFSDLLRD